jgi:hypothetical protein
VSGVLPGCDGYLIAIAKGQVGTGLSSKALALYGVGLNPDLKDEWGFDAEPCDPSDLRRCFEAYEAAPVMARISMQPVLVEWTRKVFDRYPEPQGTEAEVAAYMEQARRHGRLGEVAR